MPRRVEGADELRAKLRQIRDPTSMGNLLKASVREPMRDVQAKAEANISAISPGRTPRHTTYKGRRVFRGFASRSVVVVVRLSRDGKTAIGLLGTKSEAFYALNFFELGTSTIPKQPWLVPAFVSSRNASIAAVSRVFRERFEKIARSRRGT